jgi:hypothetical protein
MQTAMMLNERWTPLIPHPEQLRLWHSPARFKVVPAGRRSGKTERAKRKVVACALNHRASSFPDPRYFAAAPTRDQAKRIFWQDLKALIPGEFLDGRPSESDLVIKLITGAQISVVGLDKPERMEGTPWDGGILDEYANMKPQTWGMHIRPALSDRRGWCWLIGVPEGRNHYYEADKQAQAEAIEAQVEGRTPEWDSFHWKSVDILPAEEIAAARRDLDELTFLQEYEASFVNFQGRAYYVFDDKKHCARLVYDPRQPLIICLDFNVAPGVAAVCQEQRLPSGEDGTGVIGEVYIPRNSNTPAVCRRLVADWGRHEGRVIVYGDATGGARKTSAVGGNDWDLVRDELRPIFKDRLSFKVPRANPSERSRINAVNTRLLNHAGQVRTMVDPGKAPHVVKDFEGVRLLQGGSGELDKKADPELSHISDGLGYYVVYEFPTTKLTSTSQEFLI